MAPPKYRASSRRPSSTSKTKTTKSEPKEKGTCLHSSGCLEPVRRHNLCEEHRWEGDDWVRLTAVGWGGYEFTYIALKVMPPPSGWEGRVE